MPRPTTSPRAAGGQPEPATPGRRRPGPAGAQDPSAAVAAPTDPAELSAYLVAVEPGYVTEWLCLELLLGKDDVRADAALWDSLSLLQEQWQRQALARHGLRAAGVLTETGGNLAAVAKMVWQRLAELNMSVPELARKSAVPEETIREIIAGGLPPGLTAGEPGGRP